MALMMMMGALPGLLYGQDSQSRVTAIEIRGNKRIDASTIEARLTLKVEDPYTPESIRNQIRLIYGMGFFEDVQMYTEPAPGGVALVVVVREKSLIAEIVFDGNEELSDDKLQETVTIRSQSFLDQPLVKESAEKIERAYQEAGYYNAEVIPIVQTLEADRKRLTFYIKEGKQTKIQTVTFVGAAAATKKELLKVMANREHVFILSWFTDAGILNREELPNDVERIREVYMNKGYLNVQVGQPSVELTADTKWLHITLHVREGEPFNFGKIAFQGNVVFEDAELRRDIKIVEGEVFQRVLVREEVTRVTDLYGQRGYSFAEVKPAIQTDPGTKTAMVTLQIEEGKLMRIRRIHITGNDKTRDNVIRRELRVEEQQVVDTVALKRSFQRLNNLNFFETVEVLPTQVAPDKVDLEVKVKEKPTGSFSIGGGFSTLDQFVLIANVTEGNLFGRGYLVRVRGQLGQRRTLGLVTFREPHFRDSATSLQFDAFSSETDFSTYRESRTGGTVSVGQDLSEFVSGSLSLFGEALNIKDVSFDAPEIVRSQRGKQSSTGFRTSLSRDTRDFFLDPRTGWRHAVGFDFASKVFGGSNFFYKVRLDSMKYTPLFLDTRHMIRARYGIVEGLGGQAAPVPERFFVGGINTMRGFKFGRAGPVTVTNTPEGADRQIIINNDFIFPISSEAKLNGVVFFDYGIGYAKGQGINLLDLRRSVGLEARWFSPLGPLRLAYGVNLDRTPQEKKGVFEFSVGSVF